MSVEPARGAGEAVLGRRRDLDHDRPDDGTVPIRAGRPGASSSDASISLAVGTCAGEVEDRRGQGWQDDHEDDDHGGDDREHADDRPPGHGA